MSAEEWKAVYDRAWHLYYSPEHVATLLRRARAGGTRTRRLARAIFSFYGSYCFEKVHPLQAGALRRKVRGARRPGMRRENPLLFYARRAWEILSTYTRGAFYYLWLMRLRNRIERDPAGAAYTDAAIAVPVGGCASTESGRVVTTIPDYDPAKAQEAAWQLDFKKNRARRNAEALAALNRETRDRAQAATGNRRSLAIASASGEVGSAREQPTCQR
jgi:hypothetical protein